MNEAPADEWYYTRGGEMVGPISFQELKAKAANYMLSPPLDMVWTEGMEDWRDVTEIEGLRESKGTPLPAATGAMAEGEWFYILDGKPVGPVSIAELKEKMEDPSIEPPLKMVWSEGMDRWLPVYEVPALCEPTRSLSTLGTEQSDTGPEGSEYNPPGGRGIATQLCGQ